MKIERKIEVHGHRGSRGTHVENTLPACIEAVQAGADWIELDLQLSEDNQPFVFHDPVVSGRLCYTKSGIVVHPIPVRTLSASRIKEFKCGTYVDPRFPDQKLEPDLQIPTLEEILKWAVKDAPKVGLNLELKMRKANADDKLPDPEKFAGVVIDLIKKYDLMDRVLLKSFDASTVRAIGKLAPNVKLSRLFRKDHSFIEKTIRTQLKYISVHHTLLSKDAVEDLHDNDIKVLTYTLNLSSSWERMIDYGVDAIITDYPRKLIAWLEKHKT